MNRSHPAAATSAASTSLAHGGAAKATQRMPASPPASPRPPAPAPRPRAGGGPQGTPAAVASAVAWRNSVTAPMMATAPPREWPQSTRRLPAASAAARSSSSGKDLERRRKPPCADGSCSEVGGKGGDGDGAEKGLWGLRLGEGGDACVRQLCCIAFKRPLPPAATDPGHTLSGGGHRPRSDPRSERASPGPRASLVQRLGSRHAARKRPAQHLGLQLHVTAVAAAVACARLDAGPHTSSLRRAPRRHRGAWRTLRLAAQSITCLVP
jgi:hypothetical protein